jgi:hypothetical protein
MSVYTWLTHPHSWLSFAASMVFFFGWLVALDRSRYYRRETRTARFEFRASCIAGEHVCRRLAAAEETVANQAALIARLEHLNYHLSCEHYGKEATDKAIRDAATQDRAAMAELDRILADAATQGKN